MSLPTREQLHAYLDDALGEAETAQVEQALRDNQSVRDLLDAVRQERDRGEHSLGAVWRRERLTCPDREKLGAYLLEVLDDEELDYLKFHLDLLHCPYCLANLADLKQAQQEADTEGRRRRIFEAGAGLLKPGQEK